MAKVRVTKAAEGTADSGGEAPEEAPASVLTVNVGGPTAAAHDRVDGLPLFPHLGRDAKSKPAAMRVYRIDPPDGYLGQVEPDFDDEDLRNTYGGVLLELQLINAQGQLIAGGKRRLKIAADPIARATRAPTAGQASTASPAEGFADLKAEMEELRRAERQRLEDDLRRREKEAEIAMERERSRAKIELEASERRTQMQREADDARHKRDMEYMAKQAEIQLTQTREFFASQNKMTLEFMAQNTSIVTEALKRDGAQNSLATFKEAIQLGAGLGGEKNDQLDGLRLVTGSIDSLATLALSDSTRGAAPGRGMVVSRPARGHNRPAQRPERIERIAVANPRKRPHAAVPTPTAPSAPTAAPAPAAAPSAARAAPTAEPPLPEELGPLLMLLQQRMVAEGQDPRDVIRDLLKGDLVLANPELVTNPDEDDNGDDDDVDEGRDPDDGGPEARPVEPRAGGDGSPAPA